MVADLERQLLQHSDRVLYSSRAFLESERALTGDRARFLDHGVDRQHFGGLGRPTGALTDLGIRRPILGFFGGLDDYVVDFALLAKIARAFPQASLVLIGDATLALGELRALPNVHLLGFRPYAEIPRLGADFDVALMPWLDNDWIRCCNPIKLKEYLALGLEVVTTWFPEADYYREHLHIGRTHGEFLAAIAAVLEGSRSTGDRQALLEHASWDERAEELLTLLDGAAAPAATSRERPCAAS
jgi:glycosyltransferase involved in cell wall biosynthesis